MSLRKLSGDVTKWTTFWECYESAIHNNANLTKIDKFNYLKSLLEHSAAETIEGLQLTNANYDEAIKILKDRFGNQQIISGVARITGQGGPKNIRGGQLKQDEN